MVFPQTKLTLKEMLEYVTERHDISEVLERLREIAVDREPDKSEPLVNALNVAIDQALEIES